MLEPRVVVIMGVSGSGKSTVGRSLAERLGWNLVDADEHHPSRNIAKMCAGVPLTGDERAPWLHTLHGTIRASLNREESIVLACSALRADFRDELLDGSDAMLIISPRRS